MDSKQLRDLMEAYSEVYAPDQLDEASAKGGRVTGSNQNVYTPATTTSGPAGGGMGGMRGTGRNRNAYQTSSSPGALRVKPSATPTEKPAPTPAAEKPAPTPAVKPAAKPATPAAKPAAKVAPTSGAKTYSGPGYKKDTSVTDMIGRSQIRQGAPINTGNKSSDTRSMALRGTSAGGSDSSTSPKPASTSTNKATGSKKPGSIVSGFDLFDLVKGYLLDGGYAETLEEAEWLMANVIDEEAISIILEAMDDEDDEEEMKKGKKSKKEEDDDDDEEDEEDLDEALTGERYKKVMKNPGGTAYSRMVSADPSKRAKRGGRGGESDFGAGDRGSGNKAARRARTYQEEEFAIDEAQHARENPEKYEREQAKKSAPVRGERTPMPPRGDKRREDFEKWYAKQMGR